MGGRGALLNPVTQGPRLSVFAIFDVWLPRSPRHHKPKSGHRESMEDSTWEALWTHSRNRA